MTPLPQKPYSKRNSSDTLPLDYAEQTAQQLLFEWSQLSSQIEQNLSKGNVEAINQLMLRRGQCLNTLQKYFRGQSLPEDEMDSVKSTLKQYASVDQQLRKKVQTQMTLLHQKMGKLGQSRQQVGRYKQHTKSSSHTRGFA